MLLIKGLDGLWEDSVCTAFTSCFLMYKAYGINSSLKVRLIHYLSWLNKRWPKCVVRHVMSRATYQWSEIHQTLQFSPKASFSHDWSITIQQNSLLFIYVYISKSTNLCLSFLMSCSIWKNKFTLMLSTKKLAKEKSNFSTLTLHCWFAQQSRVTLNRENIT